MLFYKIKAVLQNPDFIKQIKTAIFLLSFPRDLRKKAAAKVIVF